MACLFALAGLLKGLLQRGLRHVGRGLTHRQPATNNLNMCLVSGGCAVLLLAVASSERVGNRIRSILSEIHPTEVDD